MNENSGTAPVGAMTDGEALDCLRDAISGAKPTLDQWRSAIDAALSPATNSPANEASLASGTSSEVGK